MATIAEFLGQLEACFSQDPKVAACFMHGRDGVSYIRLKPGPFSMDASGSTGAHDPLTYVAERLGRCTADPFIYHYAGHMLDLSWEDQETLRHAIDHNIPCALRTRLVTILGLEESPYG